MTARHLSIFCWSALLCFQVNCFFGLQFAARAIQDHELRTQIERLRLLQEMVRQSPLTSPPKGTSL